MKISITLVAVFFGMQLTAQPRQTSNQTLNAKADTAYLVKMVKALNRESVNKPIEKVYVQTDRDIYSRGDTLWYKAYLTIGPEHRLSANSGVLYCEMIGPDDTVIQRSALRVDQGAAWGQFRLSFKKGVYRLRAYTQWMRNFSNDYFFTRSFSIGAPKLKAPKKVAYGEPDIQFFPEGGSLIYGIRTKVAFKAIGPNGYGVPVAGTLIDNDGLRVADFKSQHLGMGIFAFTPKAGKRYTAKIITPDGHSFDASLPLIRKDGFALSVNNSTNADSVNIHITLSAASFDTEKNNVFCLIVQAEGKVYYASTFQLKNISNKISFSTRQCPAGIIQIVLCTADGAPLNERVVFLKNADSLKIAAFPLTGQHQTRVSMPLSIQVSDPQGAPAQGNFSVSVASQDGYNDDDDQNNLLTTLLLKSDLRGNIEQLGYYFSNTSDAAESLDILMLTQGYRKLDWKRTLSGQPLMTQFPAEHALVLNGLLKTVEHESVVNGRVKLVLAGLPPETVVTDRNGVFNFNNLDFFGHRQVSLYAERQTGEKDVVIWIHLSGSTPPVQRMNYSEHKYGHAGIFKAGFLDSAEKVFAAIGKPDIFKDGEVLSGVSIKDRMENNSVNSWKLVTPVSYPDNKFVLGEYSDYDVAGYTVAEQFYNPRYDVIKLKGKDLRATLYWNPLLITDKDGKASFEYVNSDRKGKYRVTIEGIDSYGHLGRKVFYYQVQ